MNTSWYCIHTQRSKERWVALQLHKSCYEVYLPLLHCQRIVRLWQMIEPLFPGYLFARFSVRTQLWIVSHTSGVVNVVSRLDGQPLKVDAEIVAILRQHAGRGYVEIQPARFLPEKELAGVTGPFQKLRMFFQRELGAMERNSILFEVPSV